MFSTTSLNTMLLLVSTITVLATYVDGQWGYYAPRPYYSSSSDEETTSDDYDDDKRERVKAKAKQQSLKYGAMAAPYVMKATGKAAKKVAKALDKKFGQKKLDPNSTDPNNVPVQSGMPAATKKQLGRKFDKSMDRLGTRVGKVLEKQNQKAKKKMKQQEEDDYDDEY